MMTFKNFKKCTIMYYFVMVLWYTGVLVYWYTGVLCKNDKKRGKKSGTTFF